MATHSILAPHFVASSRTVARPRVWARLGAMLQARHTRRLLAEMDMRLLADIGTSPAEAAHEAGRPFWDIR